MSDAKLSLWRRGTVELRRPEVALPLTLAVGFVLWGHEGRPWILGFLPPMEPAVTGMLSFAIGALVMVVLPAMALKLVGEDLRDYGLGLGEKMPGVLFALTASVLSVPVMYFVAQDEAMRGEYPLFAPGDSLIAYEASYFLFFAAVEISIRGYLLFGVRRWSKSSGLAVAVSTIVQTVWHLDKPLAELIAAPVWGVAIGVLCLRLESVWYALLFHYASNVALDLWVLAH